MDKTIKTALSEKEREMLAQRHFAFFDRYKDMSLVSLENAPDLLFRPGEETYTGDGTIVLGLDQEFLASAHDEPEFINASLYLLGHEMQHDLSTADKAWKWGLSKGKKTVFECLADRLEGKGRRFRKDADYKAFAKAMKDEKGICVSERQTEWLCHFVQNSLEDGRIERIRSMHSLSFEKLRDYFRGKFWVAANEGGTDYADTSQKLNSVLNNILSLSTTGLYMQGYDAPKDVERLVERLVPYIARGVYSPSCQACMEEAVKIENIIAPLFADVVARQKTPPEGAAAPKFHERGVTSKNEERDDSAETAAIYKKLGEEEDKEASSESAHDAVGGKDMKAESAASEYDKGRGADAGGPNDSTGEADEKQNDPQDSGVKDVKAHDEKGTFTFGPPVLRGQRVYGRDERIAKDPEKIRAEIERKMREAADGALKKEASQAMGVMPRHPSKDEYCPDRHAPVVAPESLDDVYRDEGIKVSFKELKRIYKLRDMLPASLEGQADTFKREVEKLYIRDKAPVTKGMHSGTADPSALWKLAIKQLDIFEKKQEDKPRSKAVYVLLDNSGSMGHGRLSKRWYACHALAVIEEGFKKSVPLKIVAFDAQGANCVTHEVIKGWDERYPQNCSYNFLTQGRHGYGNKDGYSIRVATNELLSRPEDDKLLIVLSDGAPTDYRNVSPEADVRDAVEKARKAGIQVASVFFSEDWENDPDAKTFISMYKMGCVCTSPDKVIVELTRVLKQFVFAKS